MIKDITLFRGDLMKLKGIINEMEKQDLKEFRIKKFICELEDGVRLVYEHISGGSSGFGSIDVLIAHNQKGIKSSIVLDPYNKMQRGKSDYEILLGFLRTYQGQKIEGFDLTLTLNKPKSTEVWIYKQRNCLNALTFNTKIEDSLIIENGG